MLELLGQELSGFFTVTSLLLDWAHLAMTKQRRVAFAREVEHMPPSTLTGTVSPICVLKEPGWLLWCGREEVLRRPRIEKRVGSIEFGGD